MLLSLVAVAEVVEVVDQIQFREELEDLPPRCRPRPFLRSSSLLLREVVGGVEGAGAVEEEVGAEGEVMTMPHKEKMTTMPLVQQTNPSR